MEKSKEELDFISKLPAHMASVVKDEICNIYKIRIPLFDKYGNKFLEEFLYKSSFRRCVQGEMIGNQDNTPLLHFIYSGQVGV